MAKSSTNSDKISEDKNKREKNKKIGKGIAIGGSAGVISTTVAIKKIDKEISKLKTIHNSLTNKSDKDKVYQQIKKFMKLRKLFQGIQVGSGLVGAAGVGAALSNK